MCNFKVHISCYFFDKEHMPRALSEVTSYVTLLYVN